MAYLTSSPCLNVMRVHVFRNLCWLLGILGTTSLQLAATEQDRTQIDDARSYVQIMNDQGDAILQFDVAARRETMMLLPGGRLVELSILERVMFDRTKNRYLHVAAITENFAPAKTPSEANDSEANDSEANAKMKSHYHAQLILDNRMHVFDGASKTSKKTEDPLQEFFGSEPEKAIDYRKLAINGTGVSTKKFLLNLASATNGDVVESNDLIKIELTTPFVSPYSDQQSNIRKWVFDSRKSTAQSYHHVFNIFWRGRIYPTLMCRAQFEWQDLNNYQVVSSAIVENRLFTSHGPENLTGEAEPNYSPTYVNCYWFSVNSKLSDKPFTLEFVSDLEQLRLFIDPKLNGAVALVSP